MLVSGRYSIKWYASILSILERAIETGKRPGFYFRVIQECEVGAGDIIQKIADGPEKMSIADVLFADQGANTYRIAVKRETVGIGSEYMHEHLKTGDMLEISAPRGDFIISEEQRPVVLLSAGIGITPLLAMLHGIESSCPMREVWWIHSSRNGANYPFLKEVEEIFIFVAL